MLRVYSVPSGVPESSMGKCFSGWRVRSIQAAMSTISRRTNKHARLVDILKHSPTPQMSYQVGFCLWLLTFEQEVAEQIQKYNTSLR